MQIKKTLLYKLYCLSFLGVMFGSSLSVALGPPGVIGTSPYNAGDFSIVSYPIGAEFFLWHEESPNNQSWDHPDNASGNQSTTTLDNKPSAVYYYRAVYCIYNPPEGSCYHQPRYTSSVKVVVTRTPGTPGTISLPSACYKQHTIQWPASSKANRYEIQKKTGSGGWVGVSNPAGADKNYYTDVGTGSTSSRQYRVRARYYLSGYTSSPSGWRTSGVCQGNTVPTVSMTAPSANSVYTLGSSVTLRANATDSVGNVTKVEFLYNNNSVPSGTDTSSPYSVAWTPQQTGQFSLTAKATDDAGATVTSTSVSIIVHAKPTAYINQPAPNTEVVVGERVTINATATDDGSIRSVKFYSNGALIVTDTQSPYSTTWPVPSAGLFDLTVVATDNHGAASSSSPVVVIKGIEPQPPASPPNNLRSDAGSPNTTGIFTLHWDTVLDTTDYIVQHCTVSSCAEPDWEQINRTPNLSLDQSGIASGLLRYRVSACNDVGCSGFSAALSIQIVLPTPQRPGETYLKTEPECSDGPTNGTSTGNFVICWDASDGSPTHYEVEELAGVNDWQTLPETSETEYSFSLKTTNQYIYRVLACNGYDDICSDYGGELKVNVIDTPIPFIASVLCDGACIQIFGLGFDRHTTVEVRAIGSNTLLATHSDILVALPGGGTPDTLQVPVDSAVGQALASTGVQLTVINPFNNHLATIEARANNQMVPFDSEGDAAPAPAINHSGAIYIATGNQVFAYNSSGQTLQNWQPFTTSGDINKQMALSLDQQTLYVVTDNGMLYAINSDGANRFSSTDPLWQLQVSQMNALAPPLIDANGCINLGAMDSTFYSIDPTGVVRWTYSATAGIEEKAKVFSDDSLRFYSLDQKLHVIPDGVNGP
jgi:Bacterial Ig domain